MSHHIKAAIISRIIAAHIYEQRKLQITQKTLTTTKKAHATLYTQYIVQLRAFEKKRHTPGTHEYHADSAVLAQYLSQLMSLQSQIEMYEENILTFEQRIRGFEDELAAILGGEYLNVKRMKPQVFMYRGFVYVWSLLEVLLRTVEWMVWAVVWVVFILMCVGVLGTLVLEEVEKVKGRIVR